MYCLGLFSHFSTLGVANSHPEVRIRDDTEHNRGNNGINSDRILPDYNYEYVSNHKSSTQYYESQDHFSHVHTAWELAAYWALGPKCCPGLVYTLSLYIVVYGLDLEELL